MTTNTPAILTDAEAARDLHRILDQIAADYGPQPARTAALELRTAVLEGRIDGLTYTLHDDCGCVIGHLADALDVSWRYDLPGWRPGEAVALQRLVGLVGPGDTPQTNRDLAALLGMLDDWLSAAERAVLA